MVIGDGGQGAGGGKLGNFPLKNIPVKFSSEKLCGILHRQYRMYFFEILQTDRGL